MQRYGKHFSMEQLIYRSITFDDGINERHNAAVRVKLVSALIQSEVHQVSLYYNNYLIDPRGNNYFIFKARICRLFRQKLLYHFRMHWWTCHCYYFGARGCSHSAEPIPKR